MDRFAPKLVTIFGGSGFVGTQLVYQLARLGYRIRVAVRRPDLAGVVRVSGGVGQVLPIQANLRNAASVQRAVAGSDIVINLVGITRESGKQRFEAVNIEGAAAVARAAKEAGVKTLVHLSVLGVEKAAAVSAYAKSKLDGEAAVLAAFPDAIIFRPGLIFGQDDHYTNLMGHLSRIVPVMPVVHSDAKLQPIHVGDVAEAIAKAVDGGATGGRIYELGGPTVETHKALIERILRESGRNRPLLPVPAGLAKLGAAVIGILPMTRIATGDQIDFIGVDAVVSDAAVAEQRTIADLGVEPNTMDEILPTYMWRFRPNGEFDRERTNTDTSVTA